MIPAEGNAVWLLGSGFSAPLGGPLLSDLFRQETKEEILAYFSEEHYPDLAESLPWVQRTFHLGMAKGLWKNAEQYLAFVDDAYNNGAGAKHRRIDKLIHDAHREAGNDAANSGRFDAFQKYRAKVIANFDRIVKRGLASEVSRFLIQSSSAAELWLPYRNWIQSLRPGRDTVVSFNYDRVIEIAAQAMTVDSSKLWFGVPGKEAPKDKVPVLRLHGSVEWRVSTDPQNPKRRVVDTGGGADLLRSPTEEIAIAAPGGTKSAFVSDHFQSLWTLSEDALTSASTLFVVGYSFPDTDPTAQHRLLGAFAAGASIGHRAAHIVMGSEVTAASRRMLSLIKSTARNRLVRVSDATSDVVTLSSSTFNIVQHPLGTQDFIGRHKEYTTPVHMR